MSYQADWSQGSYIYLAAGASVDQWFTWDTRETDYLDVDVVPYTYQAELDIDRRWTTRDDTGAVYLWMTLTNPGSSGAWYTPNFIRIPSR